MSDVNNSKFVTRKRHIVSDNSKLNYGVRNEIIYNSEFLQFNLCDYNDAYIFVRGDITVRAAPTTQVAFKNCASFAKCITKMDGTTIDDAEDLDLVIPMCSLIEYSSCYSETTRIFWFYSKDEAINFNADIANDNNIKSFKYQAKLLGNTEADGAHGILNNATTAVLLKCVSIFWR